MNMHSNKSFSSRRKYSHIAEACRYVQGISRTEDEWHHVPLKRVITRIINDITHSSIYVKGGKRIEPVNFSLKELLEHSAYFPPLREEQPTKLKDSIKRVPVFGRASYKANNLRGALKFRLVNRTYAEMEHNYHREEEIHKRVEDHHPDGEGWVTTMDKSFEVVFDVFSSLLRSNSLQSSYALLFKILATPKFEHLDVDGVYAAIMHLVVRGVSSKALYQSGKWRQKPQERLYAIARSYQFYDGSDLFGTVKHNIREYMMETNWHVAAMESELRLLRFSGHHDMSKYEFSSAFYYSWWWGCVQQLSPVNLYRLKSEKPTPIEEALDGIPTMFSLGKSFGEGVAEGVDLKKTVLEASSDVLSEAKEVLEEFKEETDKTLSKASTLVEKLTASMDSISDAFASLTSSFKGVFSSVSESVKGIPTLATYVPSFESMVAILKHYIFFINMESPLLKAMVLLSLLHELGFVGEIFSYFKTILQYCSKSTVIDGEEVEVNLTSSLLDMSFPKLIHAVLGTFTSIVKGAALLPSEFWSLIRKLSPFMRELHFLGAGCVGFERVINFVKKIYKAVSDWISENLFGMKESAKQFASQVSLLVLKANYFSTEAGYDSIRMNVNMRTKATAIFPKYLELSAKARNDPDLRQFVRDLESVRKNAQNIHDFITRLEAVSNFVPTMFHAQFVGEPGIGKSFLTKTFVKDIQRTLYPDETGDSVYSYNPNLEFFDGYAGQKIFLMDDCFRMQEPKHLTTLIGLITNTPVVLPMANLADKGTQLTSDVMLSSTNTPYPIGKDVLCMEAVHRRRHMLVETVIDPDVRDNSTGAFSMTLYLKKYKKEDLNKFPHLTFNLMRPVPREWNGAMTVSQSATEFDELKEYAQKLHDVNVKIMTPGSKNIDPLYYFSEDNRPPEPISLPCIGWTYEQLVHNFAARYCAFRGYERTFSTRRKYAHAEYAIAELEGLANQNNDIGYLGQWFPFSSEEFKPYSMISKYFSEVHHPYGACDELGQKIADMDGKSLFPELDGVDIDQVVEETLNESVPTTLTIEQEFNRIQAIKARRNKVCTETPLKDALQQMNILKDKVLEPHIRVQPHYTVWEGFNLGREPATYKFLDRLYDQSDMATVYAHVFKKEGIVNFAQALYTYEEFSQNFLFSSLAYYPNKPEFGSLAGTKSSLPVVFLKRLEYHDNDWWLNLTNEMMIPDKVQEIKVKKNGKEYTIPADLAFIMSLSETFRLFCLDFSNLPFDLQRKMVEDSKWKWEFTEKYTKHSLGAIFKRVIQNSHCTAFSYFTNPIEKMIKRHPLAFKFLAGWIFSLLFGWVVQSISKLFVRTPVQGVDTSKFMHKGTPSLIKYHGVPTASEGTANQAMNQVNTIMALNTRQIQVTDERGNSVITQSLVSGQFCIFNSHSMQNMEGNNFIVTIFNPSSDEFQEFVVPKNNFEISNDSDLVICFSPKFPCFPSIKRRLITQAEHNRFQYEGDFVIASRFQNSPTLEYYPFHKKVTKVLIKSAMGISSDLSQAILLSGRTIVGRSGSPVVYLSPQCLLRLVGIQAWALSPDLDPKVAVQVVTQEMYESLTSKLVKRLGEKDCQIMCPVETLPLKGIPTTFTSADYNSVIGEVPESVGMVGKSQIQPSLIAPIMEKDGFTSKRVPAIVSDSDPRGNGKPHFLAHSLGKFVRGSLRAFEPQKLQDAREWCKEIFAAKLDKENFQVLEFSNIITGTREDGSNPMNLHSSPGLPFIHTRKAKGKFDHFFINEEGELSYIRDGLLEEFDQFYDDLANGIVPYSLAYDFPKDELRPREKALGSGSSPPKTRTVTCMNMYFIMAWRYLTLDFWSSMHRAADGAFPFCPGMNPEGPDWTNAFYYLNRFPNVIDFDVSNWDGYLNSELFYGAGEVVSSFLKLLPRDQRAFNTLLIAVQNSFIQYKKVIYYKVRGMISGFPGTAEVNTTSHIILFLYVYLILVEGHPEYQTLEYFTHNVSFLVYGDDIIISFSDEIKSLVNGLEIARVYQEIGYPITSGNKFEEIRESKNIWNCSFLKSTWNHLHSGIYLRKMDIEIAYDLLFWCRAKEDPQEQFMSNSVDALRIVFCHGREAYDQFRHRLNGWLRKVGLSPILYSYNDVYKDYMSRYYITGGA